MFSYQLHQCPADSCQRLPGGLLRVAAPHLAVAGDHAGLPHRLFDLRHTHARLMLQQGIRPKIVSGRLGHSTVGSTLDTYSPPRSPPDCRRPQHCVSKRGLRASVKQGNSKLAQTVGEQTD